MSPSSCCVWLLLANVALLLPCPASAETRMIDNFNSPGWLDNWSLVLGEEFPGAKGSLGCRRGISRRWSEPAIRLQLRQGDRRLQSALCRRQPKIRYTDPWRGAVAVGSVRRLRTALPDHRCHRTAAHLRTGRSSARRDSLDAWHRVVLSLRADIRSTKVARTMAPSIPVSQKSGSSRKRTTSLRRRAPFGSTRCACTTRWPMPSARKSRWHFRPAASGRRHPTASRGRRTFSAG